MATQLVRDDSLDVLAESPVHDDAGGAEAELQDHYFRPSWRFSRRPQDERRIPEARPQHRTRAGVLVDSMSQVIPNMRSTSRSYSRTRALFVSPLQPSSGATISAARCATLNP